MLLTIDIGNSNVVIGCLNQDNETQCLLRMVTDLKKTEDEYAAGMQTILQHNGIDCSGFEGAIICSVVPPLTEIFRTAVQKLTGHKALVVGAGIKTGLNILIEDPASLGSDLVAAAVGAIAQFPTPLIVIDMGTATTIGVITENRTYEGGLLFPGVQVSLEALSQRAALLPDIALQHPKGLIGKSTEEYMRSGIVYGNAGMLDGIIDRLKAEFPGKHVTVVATGGSAPLILPYCRNEIIYDKNLLMEGLWTIYQKNQ